MKIAYITYEYPPDSAFGGIATYMYQVANMMKDRGHQVEIFCSSATRATQENQSGIIINTVLCADRNNFSAEIAPIFAQRNREESFDVIESPEFSGDGLEIKKAFPQIPLVVKFHTPWYLIYQLNNHYLTIFNKARYLIAGLVRGELRPRYWIYKKTGDDPDYQITCIADQIQTPSTSLGDILAEKWHIERSKIINIPYPFIPKQQLLGVAAETDFRAVSFIGRLEKRKGVIELVKALPKVFDAVPDFKMFFVGNIENSHKGRLNMKEYIQSRLRKYIHRIEFKKYAAEEVYLAYSNTDICVFPSLWENFPNVCLEAMSAARGVIGSKFGGMSDMLTHRQSGLLVDPFNHKELAEAVIYMLNNKSERIAMGNTARSTVSSRYNGSIIGELMEKNYKIAIKKSAE